MKEIENIDNIYLATAEVIYFDHVKPAIIELEGVKKDATLMIIKSPKSGLKTLILKGSDYAEMKLGKKQIYNSIKLSFNIFLEYKLIKHNQEDLTLLEVKYPNLKKSFIHGNFSHYLDDLINIKEINEQKELVC